MQRVVAGVKSEATVVSRADRDNVGYLSTLRISVNIGIPAMSGYLDSGHVADAKEIVDPYALRAVDLDAIGRRAAMRHCTRR